MNSFSSQRTETTAPSSLTVQLTAEELGKNGSCIAWTEVSGKTVRVILPGTLPGDTVEAVSNCLKRAHSAIGRDSRFIPEIPRPPGSPCPASALCGGCPLIELTSEAQLSYKKRFLEKLFSATPGGTPQILDPIPMPHGIDSGYRNKAVLYLKSLQEPESWACTKREAIMLRPELTPADSARTGWLKRRMRCFAGAGIQDYRSGAKTSQTGLLRGLILRAGSNGRLATLVTPLPSLTLPLKA